VCYTCSMKEIKVKMHPSTSKIWGEVPEYQKPSEVSISKASDLSDRKSLCEDSSQSVRTYRWENYLDDEETQTDRDRLFAMSLAECENLYGDDE